MFCNCTRISNRGVDIITIDADTAISVINNGYSELYAHQYQFMGLDAYTFFNTYEYGCVKCRVISIDRPNLTISIDITHLKCSKKSMVSFVDISSPKLINSLFSIAPRIVYNSYNQICKSKNGAVITNDNMFRVKSNYIVGVSDNMKRFIKPVLAFHSDMYKDVKNKSNTLSCMICERVYADIVGYMYYSLESPRRQNEWSLTTYNPINSVMMHNFVGKHIMHKLSRYALIKHSWNMSGNLLLTMELIEKG